MESLFHPFNQKTIPRPIMGWANFGPIPNYQSVIKCMWYNLKRLHWWWYKWTNHSWSFYSYFVTIQHANRRNLEMLSMWHDIYQGTYFCHPQRHLASSNTKDQGSTGCLIQISVFLLNKSRLPFCEKDQNLLATFCDCRDFGFVIWCKCPFHFIWWASLWSEKQSMAVGKEPVSWRLIYLQDLRS